MPRYFPKDAIASDEQMNESAIGNKHRLLEPGRYLLIPRLTRNDRKVIFLRLLFKNVPQSESEEAMEVVGRRCLFWTFADFRIYRHALLTGVVSIDGKSELKADEYRLFDAPAICWWLIQTVMVFPMILSRPLRSIGELLNSLARGGVSGLVRFAQRHIKLRRDRFMKKIAYPQWVDLNQGQDGDVQKGPIAGSGTAFLTQQSGRIDRPDVIDQLSRLRALTDQEKPSVSILIPTRDHLDMLRACVESIRQKTQWPSYEIIVIDNGSREETTLEWLKREENAGAIRLLREDRPFNYSSLNNAGAQVATGKYLCLLNNDVEVITPEWLDELMAVAELSEVGAVGAKLLYPEGVLQHAGMVLNSGALASHAWRNFPGDYSGSPAETRQVSAVTGACLLTPKAIFEEVGGLDADNLAVSLNDVDYCLKLAEAGKRVLYTPFACLYHRESLSRGADRRGANLARASAEQEFMRSKWPNAFSKDRFTMPEAPDWMAEEGWLS